LDDKQGAIGDYSQALAINPQHAKAYYDCGIAKSDLGDKQDACSDYKAEVSFGNQSTTEWLQSDGGAWCRNMR
jgi:tetratricopeptide (TPR) repeat protein